MNYLIIGKNVRELSMDGLYVRKWRKSELRSVPIDVLIFLEKPPEDIRKLAESKLITSKNPQIVELF